MDTPARRGSGRVRGGPNGRHGELPRLQGNSAQRLSYLLADPSLLGEHLANRLTPLLQRLLEKYLSDEARLVLTRLSVATIPLGKAALQVLCPRMQLLKELRSASLLARYTNRFQLLPVVAWTVQQQLAPEQRQKVEDLAIQAYTSWLDDGNLNDNEAGQVVTELVVLLLNASPAVGSCAIGGALWMDQSSIGARTPSRTSGTRGHGEDRLASNGRK